ncbi:hypothetical protein BQ8482_420017 [Mesorhizobium delmotii]|uniref:Uncharacterized protein n=1 Tax=Mesorhizobium delmotii TaxID=1631247 RepID=A0A2P9AT83_9HYPH|nr:hypothetical protein BQ8482_420017 [Mesorhizobium delmotii]
MLVLADEPNGDFPPIPGALPRLIASSGKPCTACPGITTIGLTFDTTLHCERDQSGTLLDDDAV